MTTTNDGGPAFPAEYPNGNFFTGMTLRDYMAGQALTGMCAAFPNVATKDLRAFIEHMPATAYEMADAMLKARST